MSYIGTTEIGKMFLGDVEIDKAYLGNDLVFASGPPPKKQYTITLYPSSYDTENYSWYSSSNLDRGYTRVTSTTYALITCGIGEEAYIYYKFDTSQIPNDAVIDSVSCSAKVLINGASNTVSQKKIQMFTGTTAKGTASTPTPSAAEYTLDVGTWTLAEVRDIRVRPYMAIKSSSTARYYIRFYGATLTITYTA